MKNDDEAASPKCSRNESIEQHLCKGYEFRFNTIKSKPEFKEKGSKDIFVPISKYIFNSFRRNLDKYAGITTTTENLRAILESDFSPRVNPLKEYFNNLFPTKKKAIQSLADTVTVSNSDKWLPYLTKWLVGVVANALDDSQCCNHVCLVLTGEQGKMKTTFLDHLCPRELKSYLFTGKIDPQSKDTQTLIAEYLLINIDDQLKELNKKDENALKNLITTPTVKYRRPYDTYIEEYAHTASFMASINGYDFLTDPTGSRRFLAFEVLEINITDAKAINMDDVYAEAVVLYKTGFRYWFNDTEIQELNNNNSTFQVQTAEYEMLIKGFIVPEETDKEIQYQTTSEIMNYLKTHTTLLLSEKRLGEALRKAGFERRSRRLNGKQPLQYYTVKKITPNPFYP